MRTKLRAMVAGSNITRSTGNGAYGWNVSLCACAAEMPPPLSPWSFYHSSSEQDTTLGHLSISTNEDTTVS